MPDLTEEQIDRAWEAFKQHCEAPTPREIFKVKFLRALAVIVAD